MTDGCVSADDQNSVCVFAVIIVNVHKQKLPHGTFHIEHTETVLLS